MSEPYRIEELCAAWKRLGKWEATPWAWTSREAYDDVKAKAESARDALVVELREARKKIAEMEKRGDDDALGDYVDGLLAAEGM